MKKKSYKPLPYRDGSTIHSIYDESITDNMGNMSRIKYCDFSVKKNGKEHFVSGYQLKVTQFGNTNEINKENEEYEHISLIAKMNTDNKVSTRKYVEINGQLYCAFHVVDDRFSTRMFILTSDSNDRSKFASAIKDVEIEQLKQNIKMGNFLDHDIDSVYLYKKIKMINDIKITKNSLAIAAL